MRKALVAALSLAAVVTGCTWRKDHLIQDFGKSYDGAFVAQQQPRPAPSQAVTGLDSQEAAIISDTYRAGLAPKGQKAAEEPVLVVQPPTRERRELPAPSVPKE